MVGSGWLLPPQPSIQSKESITGDPATTGVPSKFTGALHLDECLLSGTRPPTSFSPIQQPGGSDSARSLPVRVQGVWAGAPPETGEPTHIRAVGDTAPLSLFLAFLALRYL